MELLYNAVICGEIIQLFIYKPLLEHQPKPRQGLKPDLSELFPAEKAALSGVRIYLCGSLLLAEDVQKLLPSGAFSNFVPKDEVSGETYPNASGIMFVSLKRLSQENTVAGELASFLLGKTNDIKSEEVKQIADTFGRSYEEFRNDKEVKKSMSVAEKLKLEGRVEGRVEGIRELAELIRSGMSVDEALQAIDSETSNIQ